MYIYNIPGLSRTYKSSTSLNHNNQFQKKTMLAKKDIFSYVSNEYLISEVLHDAISEGKKTVDDSTTLNSGVYVIVFRLINVKSKTLVYNYTHYNDLFKECLIFFLLARNELMLEVYKEPGSFLSIIDKNLLWVEEGEQGEKPDKLSLSKSSTDNVSNQLTNVNRFMSDKHYISNVLDLINKLTYVSTYDEMSVLTKMAINKDYFGFICNILESLDEWRFNENSFNSDQILPNIINSCVFIVKEKDKLIKLVSDEFEGSLNQGPQSAIGQISSCSTFLAILDKHFRDSLYYHNKYHASMSLTKYMRKAGVKSDKDLRKIILPFSRDKLGFNNIHMNLGNVRWYTTNRRAYNIDKDLNTKALNKFSYRNRSNSRFY